MTPLCGFDEALQTHDWLWVERQSLMFHFSSCWPTASAAVSPFTSPTSQQHQSQWQQKQQGNKRSVQGCCKKSASKSSICLFPKGKGKRSCRLPLGESKPKYADADATSRRMHSVVALFFITGEGPLMVFYTTLLFQALHTNPYPAVSCCHHLNNSQHGFRNAFHAARTDTNPWLWCFRIQVLQQILGGLKMNISDFKGTNFILFCSK